jgi:prepilin-type N-terminal cleavage/methylation domain-containing protein
MSGRSPHVRRRGVTLAELLVVIAILGLIAAVAVQTVGRLPRADIKDEQSRIAAQLTAARRKAVRDRRPVVARVESGDSVTVATAFPDGVVISSTVIRSATSWERLTGRPGPGGAAW